VARISREEVERVARLARLSLDDAQAERMAVELDTILGYAAKLGELDTRDVEPTSHVIPLATPMRRDSETATIDPELAVANAPEREGSAFVVPKVIESEDEG
jgi:aspartyl-tRNA(Asn)/glutamyl-tRNA(Gln) amidotransferase subunit C